MKYRIGFVTNSSSSSYLIVGVSDENLIYQLERAEGFNFRRSFPSNYGICRGKVVDFYGNYEPNYAGIEAEKLMETMTLPQMKEHFKDLIKKKYNIEIGLNLINIHYGEVSDD